MDNIKKWSLNQSPVMSELVCQPCKDEGLGLEAFGFCLDCCDYLCEDCYKGHLRPRPMRHHTLLDKEQMLKEKDALPSKDIAVDICQLHLKKFKYFCPAHDSVGCSVCFRIEHKTCEDIVHIPQEAEGIVDSEDYKTVQQEINETTTRFKNIIPGATANIATSEASKTKVAQEISTYMKDILATIHRLENAIRAESEQCHEEDIRRMNAVISNAKESLNKMKTMKSNMVNLARMKQHTKLFIAVKTTSRELRQMQEQLAAVENHNSVRVCNFNANPNFNKAVRSVKRLGELSYDAKGPADSVENSSTEFIEFSDHEVPNQTGIKATHLKDVYINSAAEKQFFCNILGIAAFAKNRVIVVDGVKPANVSLVDTQRNRIISELILPDSFTCIAPINDKHVAVGYGQYHYSDPTDKRRGLALLNVEASTITVVKQIGSSYEGNMSSFNNDIYICPGNNTVRKINMDGRETDAFKFEPKILSERRSSTQYVQACAIYKNNKRLKSYAKIRQLTNESDSTFLGHGAPGQWVTDKVDLPQSPKAITMGADGRLLFVLADDVIYVVRVGTTTAHVLLGEKDGLYRVSAMSYCSSSRQLVVAMEHCNFVKVYQVSGQW